MVIGGFIDEVDEARQRGAFAGARGTGHEKQASRAHRQLLADVRHAQLLRGEHLVWNLPQHHRDAASLLKHAHAEAGHIAKRKAEVASALLGQLCLTTLRRDRFHEAVGVVGCQHLCGLRLHVPIDAKHRWQARGDVNIAHAILDRCSEKFVDLHRHAGNLRHRIGGGRIGIGLCVTRLRVVLHVQLQRRGIAGEGLGVSFDSQDEHLDALIVDQRSDAWADR